MEQEIQVRSIESPSRFFFSFKKRQEKSNKNCAELSIKKKIGIQISQYFQNKNINKVVPEVGSIIGYFHAKWLMWLRGKVEEKLPDGSFRLFLLDFGHRVTAELSSQFTDLPESLKHDSSEIKRGSLGLKPSETVRDKTGSYVIRPVHSWNEEAIKLAKSFDQGKIHQNDSKKYFFVTYKIQEDGTHVGDVVLRTTYETINISEKLINAGYAIREPGLVPQVPVSTVTLQPIANFEKIFTALFREEIQSVRKTKPPIMVPAGSNLSAYINQKKEVHKPMLLPQPNPITLYPIESYSPSSSSSESSSTASAPSPTDILVYGERLIAPFPFLDFPKFRNSIKLVLEDQPMTRVEAYCWPQIRHGRSMVIIADKNSISDERSFTPVIVESVKNQPHGFEPVAIIIVKTSSEVERISKICSKMDGEIRIVAASGSADKKFELMNGCDLLVSTPPAFCRLMKGIGQNLILDKNRLQHLVFHRIDTMIEQFESDINMVIRTCTTKKDNNPQIIVTSPRWMTKIKTKLMRLMNPNNLVVCFEDFLEAAAFVNCSVVIESVPDAETKKTKLEEALEKGFYKERRTIVVTNDESSSKNLSDFLKGDVQVLLADERNYKTIKTDWMQRRVGNYSVLVVSDSVLSKMELRNVHNLIHFSLPPSWERFSRRHATLLDLFYANLGKTLTRETKPSIIIYMDDELVDEFAVLVSFLQSREMVDVPVDLLETVKVIKRRTETAKCEKIIPICNRIWSSGECSKEGCSSRHIFTEADKPLMHLPIQTFIKFDLVFTEKPTPKSFYGPTSYIIKIKSQMKDSDWFSWEERNSRIEKFLHEDLQEFYKKTENMKRVVPKFGDTYAVMANNQWNRCKVMEINQNSILPVYLIDSGDDVRCNLKNFYELPDEFKKVEPLVCKLQIVNLSPFDGEENWTQLIKENQRQNLQKSTVGCTFACKVHMAIQDILFTDSFDAKDDETGAMRFRLKPELLKTNVCSIDENVSGKLRKLAVDEKLIEIRNTAEVAKKPEEKPLPIEIFDDVMLQESWKFLSCKSYYEAHLKFYENPDSFLVVLDAADKKIQKEAMKEIEECGVKSPLKVVNVGAVCAVDGPKVRRGKIMKIINDIVQVLLVDFGEIAECQRSDLLELPKDLITKLSFQTFHCRLMGLRPKYNMNSWPPKQSQAVCQVIQSCSQPLKIYIEKLSENKVEEWEKLGVNHYDVILIDPQNGSLLSDVIVKNGYADHVEYEKPADLEEALDSGNASADEAEVLSDREFLMRCVKASSRASLPNQDYDDDYEEIIQNKVEDEIVPEEIIAQPKETTDGSVMSSLNYINKHPKLEWRQNDTVVYLIVSAIDCVTYGLKIDVSSVTIAIKYVDKFEKTTIQLYAFIDPMISSHERCGLNVIIRLVKMNLYNKWPRLTDSELPQDHHKQFIKPSVEKITAEKEQERLNLPPSTSKYQNCLPEGFEDSSDNESLPLSDDETNF